MIQPTTLHKPKETESPMSQNLQKVLANTYGLYLATHNYHWNVEGSDFVPLHGLFGEQYNELFQAIDVIAERIRALDAYALPFEGEEILATLDSASNPMNKEADANERAVRMVHNLIEMNDSVIKCCQSAKKEALHSKDDESADLMIGRITTASKSVMDVKKHNKKIMSYITKAIGDQEKLIVLTQPHWIYVATGLFWAIFFIILGNYADLYLEKFLDQSHF